MNKSESITELAVALVQFNSKVTKVSKDAANPFFKNRYATLDNIIDDIRPLLAAEGLAVMQFSGGDGENVTIKNLLLHDSGEWLESEVLVMKPVKNDPQGVGSCVTYARRYSLASFLSLNTGEDDDGNAATHPNGKPNDAPEKPPVKPPVADKKPQEIVECKLIFKQIKGDTVGFDEYYQSKVKTGNSPKAILEALKATLLKKEKANEQPVG